MAGIGSLEKSRAVALSPFRRKGKGKGRGRNIDGSAPASKRAMSFAAEGELYIAYLPVTHRLHEDGPALIINRETMFQETPRPFLLAFATMCLAWTLLEARGWPWMGKSHLHCCRNLQRAIPLCPLRSILSLLSSSSSTAAAA